MAYWNDETRNDNSIIFISKFLLKWMSFLSTSLSGSCKLVILEGGKHKLLFSFYTQ